MRDGIGERGESIFKVLVARDIPGVGRLFRPSFLGDKHSLIDFHVDLSSVERPAFFHASIKATTQGYTFAKDRLKVTISKSDKISLARCVVPVYLFGIDEKKELGYLASANDVNSRLIGYNLSVIYPMSDANLLQLHKEVDEFWRKGGDQLKFCSYFK